MKTELFNELSEICEELEIDDLDQLMYAFDSKSEEDIVEFFRVLRDDDTDSKQRFFMCADALFRDYFIRNANMALLTHVRPNSTCGIIFMKLTGCQVETNGQDYIYYK